MRARWIWPRVAPTAVATTRSGGATSPLVGHDQRRYAGAIVLAVGIGMIAAQAPIVAVALVIGLGLITIVLVNVTAGLMVFIVVASLEFLPTLAGAPSPAKLVGLFLVIGWLGVAVFGPAEYRARVDLSAGSPLLTALLALFLAWVLVSMLWALESDAARSTFLVYALLFTLFPIVYAALRTPRDVEWLYSIFVAGALLGAAVGTLHPSGDMGDGDRLSGAGLNPNLLGALLAVGVVLAGVLACLPKLRSAARFTALAASILCVIAVIMTGSRGALAGLLAALLATPFLCGPGRRTAAVGLVVVVALFLFFWLAAFAPQGVASRLMHPETSGTGRVDIWTIALRMVRDKPVTGVGAGNFPIASVHYLLEPGRIIRSDFIVDQPKVAHNIYLEVLSELGFIGLSLFLAIIAFCVGAALKAARIFRRQRNYRAELLARGLTIALVALLAAYFFSSALNSKQLYLLLAVGPALLHIARRSQGSPPANY